ncbi:MAG: DUF429 domain-containing protein [Candidatus Aminicenantes bacterium]|nr:DUF429 domain-containing protein [Candidatus Aminicenantes bacterium]
MSSCHSCLIMGIDLAATSKRPTGICFFQEMMISTRLIYKNREILLLIREKKPSLVAIDAPLSRPIFSVARKEKRHLALRKCEEDLKSRRLRFLPLNFKSMKQLMRRGIHLRRKIESLGIKVIEVYPGAAQDIWKLPRSRRNSSKLLLGLKRFGLQGLREKMTPDELDAVTAAFVGYYYFLGKAEEVGHPQEGLIVLPLQENHL